MKLSAVSWLPCSPKRSISMGRTPSCMKPPPDEVRAWLRKARGDLLSARILVAQGPLVSVPAAFHCQQAVDPREWLMLIADCLPNPYNTR